MDLLSGNLVAGLVGEEEFHLLDRGYQHVDSELLTLLLPVDLADKPDAAVVLMGVKVRIEELHERER